MIVHIYPKKKDIDTEWGFIEENTPFHLSRISVQPCCVWLRFVKSLKGYLPIDLLFKHGLN